MAKGKSTEKITKAMDPSIREDVEGKPHENRKRPCWAIKQLLTEVLELFPETEYSIGEYNDRGVGLAVFFDTVYDQPFTELLLLIDADPRVKAVQVDDSGTVGVFFHNSARTQDLRESFGIDDAWDILEERSEEEGWYIGGESE